MNPEIVKRMDSAIRKGGITIEELRKQAKKHPGCLADAYLKSKESTQ